MRRAPGSLAPRLASALLVSGLLLVALALVRAAAAGGSGSERAGPAAGARTAAREESGPRRVLLVTGQDVPAHDWRATTPVTRAALEEDSGFEVRVCEDAGILESSALERYDVVVLNWRNNPRRDPAERARDRLAEFVRGGKGLVVIHFAVYAFAGWDEWPEIIGRVWVGRREGRKVSGHGPRGPFPVRIADDEHPVTRGLEGFTIDDELYARLVGDAPIHVLCEADSDWSGQTEPIAWTRRYGEGRVFVNVLGHDVESRENPSFRRLLRQGTAWAAGLPVAGEPAGDS